MLSDYFGYARSVQECVESEKYGSQRLEMARSFRCCRLPFAVAMAERRRGSVGSKMSSLSTTIQSPVPFQDC